MNDIGAIRIDRGVYTRKIIRGFQRTRTALINGASFVLAACVNLRRCAGITLAAAYVRRTMWHCHLLVAYARRDLELKLEMSGHPWKFKVARHLYYIGH